MVENTKIVSAEETTIGDTIVINGRNYDIVDKKHRENSFIKLELERTEVEDTPSSYSYDPSESVEILQE